MKIDKLILLENTICMCDGLPGKTKHAMHNKFGQYEAKLFEFVINIF